MFYPNWALRVVQWSFVVLVICLLTSKHLLNYLTCMLSVPHMPPVQWLKLKSFLTSTPSPDCLHVSHHSPLSCIKAVPEYWELPITFPFSLISIHIVIKSCQFYHLFIPVSLVISISPAILAPVIFHRDSCCSFKWTPFFLFGFLKYRSDLSVLFTLHSDFPLLLGLKPTWLIKLFMIWLIPVSSACSPAFGCFLAILNFLQLLNEPCFFYSL